MKYNRVKSAIDVWISIIIFLVFILLVACLFIVPRGEVWLYALTMSPVMAFLLWIYFGTFYELREEYLYCRSGPFVSRIRYENIESLRLCSNLLSSMALARDRIEMKEYGKGYLAGTTLISPVDRELFYQELKSRCNHLDDLII